MGLCFDGEYGNPSMVARHLCKRVLVQGRGQREHQLLGVTWCGASGDPRKVQRGNLERVLEPKWAEDCPRLVGGPLRRGRPEWRGGLPVFK